MKEIMIKAVILDLNGIFVQAVKLFLKKWVVSLLFTNEEELEKIVNEHLK
mgnify:FL=1